MILIRSVVLTTSIGVPAAQETLQMINDFSLPCCLVRFQLLCDTESDNATKEHILDMVFKAAVSDIRNGIPRWLDVIGVLSPQGASQVSPLVAFLFFTFRII